MWLHKLRSLLRDVHDHYWVDRVDEEGNQISKMYNMTRLVWPLSEQVESSADGELSLGELIFTTILLECRYNCKLSTCLSMDAADVIWYIAFDV